MSADAIAIGGEVFAPTQCSEDLLEGLLKTVSLQIFSGFTYFDFRPPIPSRHGIRHPDGALVAPGCPEWWVVEVELHTHDVQRHIEPQLEALADGVYGDDAFAFLTRHDGFRVEDYDVRVWEPMFLLVCDVATPQITACAARTNFSVLQLSTYRSDANRYALALSGMRPRARGTTLPGGVDVTLGAAEGVTLLVPLDSRSLPAEHPDFVLLGDHEMKLRVKRDRSAYVVALPPSDVQRLVGDATRYRLTVDSRLIPTHVKHS